MYSNREALGIYIYIYIYIYIFKISYIGHYIFIIGRLFTKINV